MERNNMFVNDIKKRKREYNHNKKERVQNK